MICIHTMVRERRLLRRCNGSEKEWQKHRVSWHCRQDPPTRILRLHFCNGSATMKRRTFIKDASVLGFLAGSSFAIAGSVPTGRDASAGNPLRPPAKGGIPVAFLVSDGAVVIDFAGPWEVFQDAAVAGRPDGAFSLYTVAETSRVIRASGGLRITPDYTLATAPAPKVIVIPAQNDATDAVKEWIRASSKNADVTMSVCTGAFLLASTGLLAGRSATTHHTGYKRLAIAYPDVHVRRGARFVEDGNIASS